MYSVVAPATRTAADLLTVTPAVSSSVIVNVTAVTVKPLTVAVKTMVSLSSSTSSSVICTVPVADDSPTAIVNAPGSR